jgi:hypothetical protein
VNAPVYRGWPVWGDAAGGASKSVNAFHRPQFDEPVELSLPNFGQITNT